MKKNNFLEGSFIATAGIVICKIIGLLYVIPFYALITNYGATLYSFAYSIYAVFLSLSTSGIPIAMSKLVSEYNSLGYYYTKERIYKIGKKFIVLIGIIFFFIMFLSAPIIANFIIGKNLDSGININDVSLVIRIISTALLVVPILSVTRGYLQGHKIMSPSSISNVLEQIARVLIIIAGCYISLKIMHVDEKIAIAIAVFAATIGALLAYIYLFIKIKNNNKYFNKNAEIKEEEIRYTTKYLFKQIILYALPFIIIDLLKSSYNLVDTMTIVRTLTSLGYSPDIANLTFSVIATWGNKLSMIIISISMGICASLIPSLAGYYIKKDTVNINKNINQAIQILLLITVPMTIGLWFLARPVWVVFYSYDYLSIEVFKVFIFQAITFSLFSILLNIVQTTNNTKVTILTLFMSFIGNALLNIPMMYLCHNLWQIGYQGASVSTLITQIIPIIYLLYFIHKKLNVNYRETLKNSLIIIFASIIMLICLVIVSRFYPITAITKLDGIIQTAIYAIIGILVYFGIIYKSGILGNLLRSLKNKK